MADTVYDEGREAFGVVDTRKCPYQDQHRREAWLRGFEDAKRDFEDD